MNFSNLKSEPVQYKYELVINLYIEPPSGQVSVQGAQDFIEERLKSINKTLYIIVLYKVINLFLFSFSDS